ncbi:MAG: MIP/aquaporin family protein [Bacteriovorax sp.]|jgi:glycerol uptake facilitator-like aquaporin
MNQKIIAEFFGTAFLLLVIVGSGITGETLSPGNEAIALLVNSVATGAGLFVLIQNIGPLSGAHFNPVVSLVEMFWGRLDRKNLAMYWLAQFSGAILGVWLAHLIFNQTIFQISDKNRFGSHLWISETIATFGLICTIALAGKKHVEFAPLTVASYVAAAYWFTSSTSFSNPAVTVARMLTDTFCGIAPNGVLAFIAAQILGSLLAFLLLRRCTGLVR